MQEVSSCFCALMRSMDDASSISKRINASVLLLMMSLLLNSRGDCGSCTVSVGGSRIKACVGKVPPQPKLKSLQEKGLEVK